ncbi:cation:dicarboxylase symporter family transporter [Desulfosporosinus sp. Sb-LF]|uniref:dicarboxylate/amino acid:cation symporter n=1 Tax=Desulfosporosinus sp. Sb-LF TaxID=2560027 RepID=UPI00107F5FE7|nr:cation:dicarboxylase symporter family transporter [Desulfosporosinus sp. Sb-LF]TGE31597.1 cation:dicarboxylase symporter family transporter [Desulfosporosinus sp. Sb-LF]
MAKKKIGLATKIVIGLTLGILYGYFFSRYSAWLKPVGDMFIRSIKMIVVPIVFSTIVIGIAGVGDLKKVGKLGGKTLIYFEIVTTIAILLGVTVSTLTKPGLGVNLSQINKVDISSFTGTVAKHSTTDLFVNLVPTNIVDALARADLLQVIFFAVLFGVSLSSIGEVGKPVLHFFQGVAETMFKLTNIIMSAAPYGVFALMGFTVSQFGLAVLFPLGKLVVILYLTMIFFVVVVFGIIAKFVGINLFTMLKNLGQEMLIAFSTDSSESVFPQILKKMEQFGVPKSIVSFVVPTGYTFNLDGSALYQGLAVPFIAQMYGIHLTFAHTLTIIAVLMVTSKGMAGVPGVSFVVLASTLATTGLPVEGLALIAGVDRIMDMGRTVVNVIGVSLASVVMAKIEGVYDYSRATYPLQPLLEETE